MKSKCYPLIINDNVTNLTVTCYNSYNSWEKEVIHMVKTFQLKLDEQLNREVLAKAAQQGTNKHELIVKAIKKMLADDKAEAV